MASSHARCKKHTIHKIHLIHTLQLIHTIHTIQYVHTRLLFFRSDPKTPGSGSPPVPPARCGPQTQDVAVFAAENNAICCVPPLPRDPARSSRKQCFAYFLTVVHFRKLRNNIKVGSGRNGHPVI
ncbi:hypothetical protein HMPREF1144_0493 [Klebsiella sp. OBRC7]|nr:hypothetical protein HMPREF1144_0493 [Klebsiella sp. OBRC7]